MPYQILCNGTQQKSYGARAGLSSAPSHCTPLHKIRYGISKNIIDEIAKGILEYPNDYTFLVTCAAAEHLAGYSPVGLTPLLSMEEKLNLHVCTK